MTSFFTNFTTPSILNLGLGLFYTTSGENINQYTNIESRYRRSINRVAYTVNRYGNIVNECVNYGIGRKNNWPGVE
jgi:hypothetical protein